MYEPNVTITSNLQDSLRQVEDIRDLLSTIPILPIVEGRIQRNALIETVHYTTKIEGNPLDIRVVERLAAPYSRKPEIDRDKREVLNLYKAMDFIRYISMEKNIPIDENIIKQIHAFVVRDIPEQGESGEYRLRQNAIEDNTTGERIFMPPPPRDVPRLMSELGNWLSRSPLAFHPIITAGIAHLELVAIHPFDNGNGRTARALADLILSRHGFTLRYLFSWVAQIGIDIATYHRTLRTVLGTEYGANVDPTAWLVYFAASVAKSLETKRSELLRIREAFIAAYNLGTERGLYRDQVEALMYAGTYGSVTTGIYIQSTRLSRATVVKRLNQLVEAGLLQVEGKGRNVCYTPGDTMLEAAKTPKHEGKQLEFKAIDVPAR